MDVRSCEKCNTPLDAEGACITCAARGEGLELVSRSGYASVKEMMELLEDRGLAPEVEQVPPRRPEEAVHPLWNLYLPKDEVPRAVEFLRGDWADLLEVPLWGVLAEAVGWDSNSPSLDDLTRHRLIRRLIGMELGGLLHQTEANLRASGVGSVAELQRLPHNVIAFGAEMEGHNRILKDFLYQHLYRHYRVMRVSVKTERIVTALWQVYLDEPGILPAHVRRLREERPPQRVVCDYIAGMTDRFAIQEYQRVFEPEALV